MTDKENANLIARLHPIAIRFRAALEHLKRDWEQIVEDADDQPREIGVFGTIKLFPWSCCDKTTLLLVRYLAEQGFTDVRSVYGSLPNPEPGTLGSHEWIEVGAVIIDITADRFEKVRPRPEPIIVTTDRSFHDRYTVRGDLRYSPGWAAWKGNNILD